jgi:ABC-type multidrug transport system ATPase subunit
MRIQLSAVSKRFGKTCALNAIDLDVPSGSKVALIGPNGSGKTTLIRVLLGLVRHTGEVRIDGKAIDRDALAPRLAYVPQIAPQMAASCGELVRAISALRDLPTAAVRAAAANLDLSLDAISNQPFRTLSGGSKQKLLLALALATRPALLILDEPTASLDAEARGRFLRLQRELAGEATLILCSHRLDEIRSLVDHVVALDTGRVVHDGPAADYLTARVGSMLELRVSGPHPWLAAHAFVAGNDGWWSRSVDRATKLELVPAALAALGGTLVDLNVRDVDLVELRGEAHHVAA